MTEAESYYDRLVQISDELGNAYDLDNLLTITCTFSVIHDEHEQFQFSLFELKNLVNTKELERMDRYFQDFEIHERLYLPIYLLGTKASRTLDTGKNDNILLLQLSQTLIQEFEQII